MPSPSPSRSNRLCYVPGRDESRGRVGDADDCLVINERAVDRSDGRGRDSRIVTVTSRLPGVENASQG